MIPPLLSKQYFPGFEWHPGCAQATTEGVLQVVYPDGHVQLDGTTRLPWKKNEYLDTAGDVIVCAAHGTRFDITTGICISGPCRGESLSAIAPHVRRDGQLVADVHA